jgi:hypothetical protein
VQKLIGDSQKFVLGQVFHSKLDSIVMMYNKCIGPMQLLLEMKTLPRLSPASKSSPLAISYLYEVKLLEKICCFSVRVKTDRVVQKLMGDSQKFVLGQVFNSELGSIAMMYNKCTGPIENSAKAWSWGRTLKLYGLSCQL